MSGPGIFSVNRIVTAGERFPPPPHAAKFAVDGALVTIDGSGIVHSDRPVMLTAAWAVD